MTKRVSYLIFSNATSAEEYSGRNRLLPHVLALGRRSFSTDDRATLKGLGNRLRPVMKRMNRLRSSLEKEATADHK